MGWCVRAAVLLAVLGSGCSDAADDAPRERVASEQPLVVYAVNHPLQYFAERIGGPGIRVVFPAPPQVDPADWSPEPEVVAAFQRADLILLNGAGYARWVHWASLPRTALVDTSAAHADRLIALEDATTHGHGPQGPHSHAGTVSTTWLDPMLALEQARSVAEALAQRRPAQREAFRSALAALEADLRALDARIQRIARAIGPMPLLFSHPVYAYLERRYQLNGRSLHWELHELPDEAAWRGLEALLAAHAARWMIWEAPPRREVVRRLESLGLRSIVFAPCGNRCGERDWLEAMRVNAERLAALVEG